MTLPPVAERDPHMDSQWETPLTRGADISRATQRQMEIADRQKRIDAAKSTGTDIGESQLIASESKQFSGVPSAQLGVREDEEFYAHVKTPTQSQIVRVYDPSGTEAGEAIGKMGIPILKQWREDQYQVFKIPSRYDVSKVKELTKGYIESKPSTPKTIKQPIITYGSQISTGKITIPKQVDLSGRILVGQETISEEYRIKREKERVESEKAGRELSTMWSESVVDPILSESSIAEWKNIEPISGAFSQARAKPFTYGVVYGILNIPGAIVETPRFVFDVATQPIKTGTEFLETISTPLGAGAMASMTVVMGKAKIKIDLPNKTPTYKVTYLESVTRDFTEVVIKRGKDIKSEYSFTEARHTSEGLIKTKEPPKVDKFYLEPEVSGVKAVGTTKQPTADLMTSKITRTPGKDIIEVTGVKSKSIPKDIDVTITKGGQVLTPRIIEDVTSFKMKPGKIKKTSLEKTFKEPFEEPKGTAAGRARSKIFKEGIKEPIKTPKHLLKLKEPIRMKITERPITKIKKISSEFDIFYRKPIPTAMMPRDLMSRQSVGIQELTTSTTFKLTQQPDLMIDQQPKMDIKQDIISTQKSALTVTTEQTTETDLDFRQDIKQKYIQEGQPKLRIGTPITTTTVRTPPHIIFPRSGVKNRRTKNIKKRFLLKREFEYHPSLIGITLEEEIKTPPKLLTGFGIRRVLKGRRRL